MELWLARIYAFLIADPLRLVVLGSLIGAVLSVPFTWLFTWLYYRRAARNLRDAAEEMKRESQHLRNYLRDLFRLEREIRS
jgi:uncharacterized membrane protein (DUF485 family)